jgi:protoporphyrinogen/coproporphyrinogen III oxidase
MSERTPRYELVVVGGGIAGLAGAKAAWEEAARLRLPLGLTVLEAGPRFGGKVWTEHADGVPLEWGPDSVLADRPRGRGLAEELGLGAELVAGPISPGAYLLRGGRLRPLPSGLVMGVPLGLGAVIAAGRAGILSPWGALRVAFEPLLPRTSGAPTVAAKAGHRLGREAAEHLIEPLVRSVCGAPGTAVGFAEAFPDLARARSISLGLRRRPGRQGPAFLTIRGGMGRLVEALTRQLAELAELRTEARATAVRASGERFTVVAAGEEVPADAVLLAVPAPTAAGLVADLAPEAATAMGDIRYSASAVAALRFPPGSLGRELDRSGYLVPPDEPGVVTACSWMSAKWPGLGARGPLLRAVVTDPPALQLSDEELADRVTAEVSRVMHAGRDPDLVRLRRWPQSLPVFEPGHAARIALATGALPRLLATAGASLGAVGVPDCIASGERAARKLVRELLRRSGD